MGIGFFYSLFLYFLFPAQSFSEHILNPYIYSVILGFSLMQGILTIRNLWKRNHGLHALSKLRWTKKNWYSLLFLLAFYMIFVSNGPIGNTKFPFLIFLIIIPLALMLGISTLTGVAETGFWISALEDILPIFLILLTQTTDMFSIVTVVSGFTAFEMCGIYYIINRKTSSHFSISTRKIKGYSFLSLCFTSIIGIGFALILMQAVGVGSSAMPAPNSQVFGMTVSGLMESVTTLHLPEYINPTVLILSGLFCIVLNRTPVSPMIILSGIMLPFGTYLVIGIGALLSYFLRENETYDNTFFSGLSVGDGLISSLCIILQAFL